MERYPDPHLLALKSRFAEYRRVEPQRLAFGVGSDEILDLIIRISCVPGKDKILICPPTYGMYTVSANVNDVGIVRVPLLLPSFQLDVAGILRAVDADTKVLFFCSPGNPTGTLLSLADIRAVLDAVSCLVVVDVLSDRGLSNLIGGIHRLCRALYRPCRQRRLSLAPVPKFDCQPDPVEILWSCWPAVWRQHQFSRNRGHHKQDQGALQYFLGGCTNRGICLVPKRHFGHANESGVVKGAAGVLAQRPRRDSAHWSDQGWEPRQFLPVSSAG